LPAAELDRLAATYLDHALAGRDSEAVRTILDPLVTNRLDLRQLYEGVLVPVAERVGELWHRAEITVADEHFVTQLNQSVISVAVTLTTRRTQHHGQVVLACPPDEQHDTGLRMLAHMLGASGYQARLLGASTPVPDLAGYVERMRPVAVGLSVASPFAIPGLERATAALRDLTPTPRIFVGGRVATRYPAIAEALGITVCAGIDDALAFLAAGD
jgi:methanogenic corrinoid protein MtbC1